MQAVISVSVVVLIIFAPLAFRLEAFFSIQDECVYFDIKFFTLRLFRKKYFLKNRNIFYFKRYKLYPLITGKTDKNKAEILPSSLNEALNTIGEIDIHCDFLLSTENPFRDAIAVSLFSNILGSLSALNINVSVNSAISSGKKRLYFKFKALMKTDFVKIILTALTILKNKRR